MRPISLRHDGLSDERRPASPPQPELNKDEVEKLAATIVDVRAGVWCRACCPIAAGARGLRLALRASCGPPDCAWRSCSCCAMPCGRLSPRPEPCPAPPVNAPPAAEGVRLHSAEAR